MLTAKLVLTSGRQRVFDKSVIILGIAEEERSRKLKITTVLDFLAFCLN